MEEMAAVAVAVVVAVATAEEAEEESMTTRLMVKTQFLCYTIFGCSLQGR